jgi:glycosyltransferase involved in cell wall biosynthesis
LIVGDPAPGQEANAIALREKVRSLGLEEKVILYGHTDDMNSVWSATDIAAVPSLEPEPFGRVAIEAMRASLPVVASDHGGLSEIVVNGETGYLVSPGDAYALAAALAKLLGSAQQRAAMGERGRVRQSEYFTQAEHDRRVLSVIRAVCH